MLKVRQRVTSGKTSGTASDRGYGTVMEPAPRQRHSESVAALRCRCPVQRVQTGEGSRACSPTIGWEGRVPAFQVGGPCGWIVGIVCVVIVWDFDVSCCISAAFFSSSYFLIRNRRFSAANGRHVASKCLMLSGRWTNGIALSLVACRLVFANVCSAARHGTSTARMILSLD